MCTAGVRMEKYRKKREDGTGSTKQPLAIIQPHQEKMPFLREYGGQAYDSLKSL
jgi:hypothetical protein